MCRADQEAAKSRGNQGSLSSTLDYEPAVNQETGVSCAALKGERSKSVVSNSQKRQASEENPYIDTFLGWLWVLRQQPLNHVDWASGTDPRKYRKSKGDQQLGRA